MKEREGARMESEGRREGGKEGRREGGRGEIANMKRERNLNCVLGVGGEDADAIPHAASNGRNGRVAAKRERK